MIPYNGKRHQDLPFWKQMKGAGPYSKTKTPGLISWDVGSACPHFPSAEPRTKGPGLLSHRRFEEGASPRLAWPHIFLNHDNLAGGADEQDKKLIDGKKKKD